MKTFLVKSKADAEAIMSKAQDSKILLLLVDTQNKKDNLGKLMSKQNIYRLDSNFGQSS